MIKFICYPKCTTCQRAKKWLDEQGIACTVRHIREEKPTAEELSRNSRAHSATLRVVQKL